MFSLVLELLKGQTWLKHEYYEKLISLHLGILNI